MTITEMEKEIDRQAELDIAFKIAKKTEEKNRKG